MSTIRRVYKPVIRSSWSIRGPTGIAMFNDAGQPQPSFVLALTCSLCRFWFQLVNIGTNADFSTQLRCASYPYDMHILIESTSGLED